MAKSSYIANLINNKLPSDTYKNRYLTELWDINSVNTYSSYKNSILNNFTNEVSTIITESDYLNSQISINQTVSDLIKSPNAAMVTLDTKYLPVSKLQETMKYSLAGKDFKFKCPANYLPATITSIKGGKVGRTIPILFPSSFSRTITASFAKENPVGSDMPIVAFSHTDAEQIPLEFDALADYLPDDFTTLSEYIEEIISILKPNISNNIVQEPRVVVEFADIKFTGICDSINISYDNVYNYKSFVHAKIQCNFTRLS